MAHEEDSPTSRFASLANPTYRKLWWGGSFIFLAMQVQMVARGWLAYELIGTNTALGGVLIGFGVATLIAIPTGGVIADRFNKRTILVLCQIANTITALAIALAITGGIIAYWMIVAASVAGGASLSLLAPARMAMTAEIVERSLLTNAVMLSTLSIQTTRIIGPAVAGLLIALDGFGAEGVYYVSALLSAISIPLTLRLPKGAPTGALHTGPLEDMFAGFRYVRDRAELTRLLLMSVVVVVFGFAHTAFLPTFVEDIFERGPADLGFIMTAAAVGAVIVSATLANAGRTKLASYQARSAVGMGVMLLLFAVMPSWWGALVVMVMLGGAMSAFQSLNSALVLSIADMEYHGRVQSLIMYSYSAFGLAALPFGILADRVGLRETLTAMAVVVLIATAFFDRWRHSIASKQIEAL
jgi:MFS family permease